MFWTKDQVAGTIGILGRFETISDALPEIARFIGSPVTYDQVQKYLRRSGYRAPAYYLKRKSLAEKAKESVINQIHSNLEKQVTSLVNTEPVKVFLNGQHLFSANASDFKVDDLDNALFNRPERITKIMVCPDAHHPYVDKRAWKTFLNAVKAVRPDILVIVGDFADILSLSSHPKSPKANVKFKKELAGVLKALDQVQALGVKRVIFCAGNHEYRIDRYVASKAPELDDMMNINDLLKITDRGFEYVPYGEFIRVGHIAFTHDVGRCGVNAARQSLQDFGDNLVFGHSHRAQVVYGGTVEGKTHVCMNVGWLGDYDAIDYRNRATAKREWQHAFGLIYQTNDGTSYCNLVPIINGSCVVDGKLVRA